MLYFWVRIFWFIQFWVSNRIEGIISQNILHINRHEILIINFLPTESLFIQKLLKCNNWLKNKIKGLEEIDQTWAQVGTGGQRCSQPPRVLSVEWVLSDAIFIRQSIVRNDWSTNGISWVCRTLNLRGKQCLN